MAPRRKDSELTVSPVDTSLPGSVAGLPRQWLESAYVALPAIARDITDRIRTEVPEYGADPGGVVSAETRRAVREALTMFTATTARGLPPDGDGAEAFRRLGRQEARAGRSHDTLQSAYRVASQAAMHQLFNWAREHAAPPEVTATLSSAVFGFIDDLARFSAEGYAEAQHAVADEQRAQAELVALLVHRDGFVRRPVCDAAERLGWALPATVTVLEAGGDLELAAADGLFGPAALRARVGERCLVVVPGTLDVADLRDRVRALGGEPLFVVGPTVPLVEAGSSARLAQRLRLRHDVRDRAVDGVARCDDCMIGLILDAGRDATRALASSRLLPLSQLSIGKRLKYGRLLSAWLEFGTLSADEPGVLDKHRQTLRYQCAKLELMFGDALHDRDARLEIMLALRAAIPLWERQADSSRASRRG